MSATAWMRLRRYVTSTRNSPPNFMSVSTDIGMHTDQRWRGFEKVGGAGSCSFPTDRELCKFTTKEIMGAQMYNFAAKLSKNRGFGPKFGIFGRDFFSHKKNISRQPRI